MAQIYSIIWVNSISLIIIAVIFKLETVAMGKKIYEEEIPEEENCDSLP